MIFSSATFLLFWIVIIWASKKYNLNNLLSFGLLGCFFYFFQGYLNFLALFSIFLTSLSYFYLKRFFYFFLILSILPLFLFKYIFIVEYIGITLDKTLIEFFLQKNIPPGLSFITFSNIALMVFIKRNIYKYIHPKSILSYLFYFPQLIAGPIVLPNYLIPQLDNFPKIETKNIKIGFFIFSIGVALKIFIADQFSIYVDLTFDELNNKNIEQIIIACLLFSQQIFFDFQGYTLMAIGISKSFGIDLPENFNAPYLSNSLRDFWRRWHITLSNWIRDFIYIPLGGSKAFKARIYFNILISMTLSGIWHGYGLTFVIWGFLHGLTMCIEKFLKNSVKFKINNYLKILFTYLIITFFWSIFRVENIEEWILIFSKDFSVLKENYNYLIILIISLFLNYFQKFLVVKNLEEFFNKLNSKILLSISITVVTIAIILSKGSSEKFIYFNF